MSTAVLVALGFHSGLKVVKKLLLRPDDRPRTANATERGRLRGGVPVVLHHVQGYVRSGSAEASLAVNSDRTLFSAARYKDECQSGKDGMPVAQDADQEGWGLFSRGSCMPLLLGSRTRISTTPRQSTRARGEGGGGRRR